MRPLRAARENPVIVLCIGVTLLIAWIAVDLARIGGPKPGDGVQGPPLMRAVRSPFVDPTETEDSNSVERLRAGTLSAAILPKLKAGMKRVEVEGLLGPPSADRVHPVTLSDGRMTYRTAYELDESGTPMTIRPIKVRPRIPVEPAESRVFVALEFDASQPGHPLVGVLYPDPLF